VLQRLGELSREASFWQVIWSSLSRILQGFGLALLCGTFLAALAQHRLAYAVIHPPIDLMKATPVASITILVLFWVPSHNLSVVISFMMVLPIVFHNVCEGLQQIDVELVEMATVFRFSLWKRLRHITFPSILPFLASACSIGFGQAWKSGIAAEVIALPRASIGMNLYNAKIFLQNADLLAWTLVIVFLSHLMEKSFLALLRRGGFHNY